MNFNELASYVAKQEGKKHNATVGDVREILSLVFGQLALMNVVDLGKLLAKYVKSRTKNIRVE